MDIREATNKQAWDTFLASQQFRPFLQSYTMGEVYNDVGQKPVRLEAWDGDTLVGVCQAIVVPARRGKHLTVPYGPVVSTKKVIKPMVQMLQETAKKEGCCFVRFSPFWKEGNVIGGTKPAPLHLLAEHIWYIPLREVDLWEDSGSRKPEAGQRTEEEIQKDMRKNTRNLIRRAGREGVTIERSSNPVSDLPMFIELHEETRKRHGFTPYTNAFFEAQVKHFAPRNECSMYKAMYKGELIACSIHMHAFGETSYHHGASTHRHAKIPASYLLQWTAIEDALKRGDHVYSFWGIAPQGNKKHPFAGVTTFKMGFGGKLLNLTHCMDAPVHPRYYAVRALETIRKWRRGF